MKKPPTYTNLIIRLILSTLGIIFIIGLPLIFGYKESYSRYYDDSPLIFTTVFSILAIGLFFHRNKEWTYSSIFLIILALFNMYDFPIVHYISAAAFFFTSTYAMWNDKRVKWFGRVSAISYIFFILNLFWFEMIQVLLICIFHLIYIIRMFNLKVQKIRLNK